MRHWFAVAVCAVLLSVLSPARADNVQQFGAYTIYYNAFNAGMLDARVAKAYKLGHGCGHGALTVAVRTHDGGSVNAKVNAVVTNLIGQRSTIDMHEVRDGKVVYYVGGFGIANDGDPLKIMVRVHVPGMAGEKSFDVSQEFYRC